MRNSQAIDELYQIAKFIKNHKFSKKNLQIVKQKFAPIFTYYMCKFGKMGYYHDWYVENIPENTSWNDLISYFGYYSDRMNFGRLVFLCLVIERCRYADCP